MKILVIGGNGFLGKHVIKLLNDSNEIYAPTSRQLDVTNGTATLHTVNELKPDVILHMAAKCGGILSNKNSPADFLRDNTQMGLNIYEAARISNIQKIYSLGSVCMYPVNCPVPFQEDNIWNGAAESTNFPYGQSKRTLLMLSQTYREQYGIGGAFLIPVNLFGKGDHFDLINSHVIPALINKFVNASDKKLPTVECWATGRATREFLYADDAAKVIAKTVLSGFDSNLPINLGTGKEISIRDLAYLIKDLTGFNGEIIFNGQVSDGQPRRCLDISRAKTLLDWTAETSLRDGLIETIAWYRANKDK